MTIRISLYLDSHDTSHLPATIATLHRAGASRALCMISGPNGWCIDPLRWRRIAAELGAEWGGEVVAVAFPPVNGNHAGTIAHYLSCRAAATGGQLDAEPKQVSKGAAGKPIMAHWTPALLARWLAADPTMSVTSTRVELPRLGKHGRRTYLQLEQQTSFATLGKAIDIADDFGPRENIVLVQGAFNQPGDPRTVPEFLADCEAAKPQATLVGEHAVWSAHTLTPPKCDALRATFG